MLYRRTATTVQRALWTWSPLFGSLALGALAPQVARPAPTALHFSVVDLHVDLPYQALFKHRDLAHGSGQYRAETLLDAGVSGVVLPLFVPKDARPHGPSVKHYEESYATLQRRLPGIPPYTTTPCRGGTGRVDAFYSFEGIAPLTGELDAVFRWAARGVRLFGIVHAEDDAVATSAGYGTTAANKQRGLSQVGQELVRRIHATGGIVDVSHASDATFSDVVRQATADDAIVVATHSNARAIASHGRNLTDAQLRIIAERGGVVGINFHSPYLLGGAGRATIEDVVRHIRHVARVAGIDAVAIGSDFEGGIRPPVELPDASAFPALARALLTSGFAPDEVQKMLSLNARRVLCRTLR
jgi:membrane dipeptidase